MKGRPATPTRTVVRVQLPCSDCLHRGVCLIEEALEQDLTLQIGDRDALTKQAYGGPGVPVEVRIDCSWFDPRPLRPPPPKRPRRSNQVTEEGRRRMRENALRVKPWLRNRHKESVAVTRSKS